MPNCPRSPPAAVIRAEGGLPGMRVGVDRLLLHAQGLEARGQCAHFVPDDLKGGNGMYLDVFSCKPYDPETVVKVAEKWFKFGKYKTAFVERQA